MMRKSSTKFPSLQWGGKTFRFLMILPLLGLSIIFNQLNAQNYAINFDGTSGQHIETTTMIPFSTDYTVMGWLNVTGTTSRIFSWGSPQGNNYVNIEIYSNKLRFYIPTSTGAVLTAAPSWSNTGWHHFAVTVSSKNVKVYVDGVEESSGSYTKNITPTTTSFGAGFLNGSFQGKGNGTYDILSVWNVALVDTDIVTYMTSSPVGTEAGIVALYDFNNPAVTSEGNNVGENIVTDITGNGYTGTLVGFPLTGTTGNWVDGYMPSIAPILTTTAATEITDLTATSGGDITDNGGEVVTVRGVCWNTTGNPTITDNPTSNGSGIGTFVSELSGLTEQTTYYVRAYATNSIGTTYGNEEMFDTLATNPTVPVSDWGIVIGMMLILGVTLVSVRL